MRYLCTFAPGLERPVADALREDLRRARTLREWSGLVEVDAAAGAARLRALPYLNNAFALLAHVRSDSGASAARVVRRLLADGRVDELMKRTRPERGRSFRVVFSRENRLESLDPQLRAELERRVQQATGLRPERRGGDCEYWILLRREGDAFFLQRLTRRAATEKDLERGELRPEIANLLCRMSRPTAADRFLDPFAGTGAIALQRARLPFRSLTCVDADAERVRRLRRRLERTRLPRHADRRAIHVSRGDARELVRVGDGEVDRVVTDPPWGHYAELPEPPARFYTSVLRETRRVLANDGVAVFLIGEGDALVRALEAAESGLSLNGRSDILLSGRPASVLTLRVGS